MLFVCAFLFGIASNAFGVQDQKASMRYDRYPFITPAVQLNVSLISQDSSFYHVGVRHDAWMHAGSSAVGGYERFDDLIARYFPDYMLIVVPAAYAIPRDPLFAVPRVHWSVRPRRTWLDPLFIGFRF